MTEGIMMVESNNNHDGDDDIMNFPEQQLDQQQPKNSKRKKWVIRLAFVIVLAIAIGVGVSLGNNKDQQDSSSLSSSTASTVSMDVGSPTTTTPMSSNPTLSTPISTPTPVPSNSIVATETPVAMPLTNVPTTDVPTMVPSTTESTTTTTNAPPTTPGEIIDGTTSNGIAYLRCTSSSTASADKKKQIVLLHGSSFSKETWLSDDMLTKFCAGAETVIALDFPVSTNYEGLMDVLDDLKNEERIINEPVTLVTPSASGYSIVTWMTNGDVTQLSNYVSEWVPVATGSLVSASDEQVIALRDLPGFRILAINGNDDSAGGKYSARLADLANATAVELTGRHAVYLQSPDDFVNTILQF
jgi:hypothetical protein